MTKKKTGLPGAMPGQPNSPPTHAAFGLAALSASSATTSQPLLYPESLPFQITSVVSDGAGSDLPPLTDGQIWVGNTGLAPSATTPTGSNGININASAGALGISQTFGTTSNRAAAGNDSRFNPTPSAAGRIPYDNGTGYSSIPAGTAHQLLHGGATPTMSAVDLTNDVTNAAQIAGPPATPPASNLNLAFQQTTPGHRMLVVTTSAGDQVKIGPALQSGSFKGQELWTGLGMNDGDVIDLDLGGLPAQFTATNFGQSNSTQAQGALAILGNVTLFGSPTGFSSTIDNPGTVNLVDVMGGSNTLLRVQNKTGAVAVLLFVFDVLEHTA